MLFISKPAGLELFIVGVRYFLGIKKAISQSSFFVEGVNICVVGVNGCDVGCFSETLVVLILLGLLKNNESTLDLDRTIVIHYLD